KPVPTFQDHALENQAANDSQVNLMRQASRISGAAWRRERPSDSDFATAALKTRQLRQASRTSMDGDALHLSMSLGLLPGRAVPDRIDPAFFVIAGLDPAIHLLG